MFKRIAQSVGKTLLGILLLLPAFAATGYATGLVLFRTGALSSLQHWTFRNLTLLNPTACETETCW